MTRQGEVLVIKPEGNESPVKHEIEAINLSGEGLAKVLLAAKYEIPLTELDAA